MNKTLSLIWIVLGTSALVGCSNGSSTPDVQTVIEAGGQTDATRDVNTTDVTNVPDSSRDVTTVDATTDVATDVQVATDGGSWVDGCFVGRPVLMTEFLNRCTTAETTTHTIMAPRIQADGGVPALP